MADAHHLGPLLNLACAGDQGALAGLLEKLRPYVRLLVQPRIGTQIGRKLDDSDLIQETLLRVYQGFGEFQGKRVPQFLGWVGQIAGSGPYRATRDMVRVHESLRTFGPEDWHGVVLQLDHSPVGGKEHDR